ncbi:hypothetical protein Tco_0819793 [Tanacetum coccineum]|uniref:Reverse transcriptase domain-containing protein n=1 Tax=Tanacetum coccineum TaxID=301880 RepID=A0ABQ5A9A9_9ASTR
MERRDTFLQRKGSWAPRCNAVEILDREVKSLKRSKIPIVKVRWNSKCGPEFTWEREDHMKAKLVKPLELTKVNLMRKVKLGRLASETVGLHAEFP